MTHSFKLSRRIARLRAPLFASIILTLVGCNTSDSLDPNSNSPVSLADPGPVASATPAAAPAAPALASGAKGGGIPFGTSAHPTSELGSRYNGALRNIGPQFLLRELAAIKARGGRVILMFAGNQKYYRSGGRFSMDKWKSRIDRYKNINFSSYINDGTVIGHFLIDEPNDPANWAGQPIPASVVEQMAQYSKQLWPGMATIARTAPSYLGGSHPYLDAAWAQYLNRRGDVQAYIRQQVADAQSRGLGLIVGLNVIRGGPNGSKMTPSQIESYGSAMLSSTYPCAFISWQWNAAYLNSSGIGSAMDMLARQAQNRSAKSCRG